MKTFKEYWKAVGKFKKVLPNPHVYSALALAGEAGEVANEMKKVLRASERCFWTYPQRERLLDEMGDVLWYLASLSEDLDSDLDEVAIRNCDKLRERHGEQSVGLKTYPDELTRVLYYDLPGRTQVDSLQSTAKTPTPKKPRKKKPRTSRTPK